MSVNISYNTSFDEIQSRTSGKMGQLQKRQVKEVCSGTRLILRAFCIQGQELTDVTNMYKNNWIESDAMQWANKFYQVANQQYILIH